MLSTLHVAVRMLTSALSSSAIVPDAWHAAGANVSNAADHDGNVTHQLQLCPLPCNREPLQLQLRLMSTPLAKRKVTLTLSMQLFLTPSYCQLRPTTPNYSIITTQWNKDLFTGSRFARRVRRMHCVVQWNSTPCRGNGIVT